MITKNRKTFTNVWCQPSTKEQTAYKTENFTETSVQQLKLNVEQI